MAFLVATGKTWSGGTIVDGAGRRSRGAHGCKQLSSFSVVVLTAASLSSEHSIRIAPLTSPSSGLADAVAVICCSGVLADEWQRWAGVSRVVDRAGLISTPASYCNTWLIICVVRFLDFPPRLGLARYADGKPSSRDQQVTDIGCEIASLISFTTRFPT